MNATKKEVYKILCEEFGCEPEELFFLYDKNNVFFGTEIIHKEDNK